MHDESTDPDRILSIVGKMKSEDRRCKENERRQIYENWRHIVQLNMIPELISVSFTFDSVLSIPYSGA